MTLLQAAIAGEDSSNDDKTQNQPLPSNSAQGSPQITDPGGSSLEDEEEDIDFSEVIGTKCRVMYSQKWGAVQSHNAMVISTEPLHPDREPSVCFNIFAQIF